MDECTKVEMERVAGRVMQLSERSDGDVELSCLVSFFLFSLYLPLSTTPLVEADTTSHTTGGECCAGCLPL